MIPAKKTPRFGAWFAGVARKRLAGGFASLRAAGLDEARRVIASSPVIVVANHTSWWDPLVALHVAHTVLGADAYAMMDAANLRRLPFFRRVGAFGVDLADPADGARAIRYAARLLDAPGRLVWIFPQGRERPVTARPLGFRPGSAEVARLATKATVLPVALRYELGATARPTAFVEIGAPLEPDRDLGRARAAQENAVESALAQIDAALCNGELSRFETLLEAKPSPVFSLSQRALATLFP